MALFYRGKHGKRICNEEHAFLLSLQLPPPLSYYIKASSKGKFLTATQREERKRERGKGCMLVFVLPMLADANSHDREKYSLRKY